MEVAIRIFGICMLIFGVFQLRSILKDKSNPEFWLAHRLDINSIVISFLMGVFTLFDVVKQLLKWINQQ